MAARCGKRELRRQERAAGRAGRTIEAALTQELGQLGGNLRRSVFWINQTTAQLPRQFTAAANAGSFAVSAILRLSLLGALLLTGATGLVLLEVGRPQTASLLYDLIAHAVSNPLVIAFLFFLVFSTVRTIQKRLDDVDVEPD